jgi:3-deoxy-D-manno-octulosonic-acid transferase
VKGLVRTPLVQGLLAGLIAVYSETVIATLRWRLEDFESARAALASDEGLIALFWHGRIAQAIACRPLLGEKPRRVMISHSRDGAFIALAAERLGIPAIRGSTGREDKALAKGGAEAFRAAVKAVQAGGAVLVTPDGPRGPDRVMPEGPVQLARLARCPVFAMGLAARPALALNSWDHARLPLPFARAALVVAGPFRAPVRLDAAGAETLRAEWQSAMAEAEAKADALLGAGSPARKPLPLRLYGALGRSSELLAKPWLRRRLARGKEDPARWREKLGVATASRPSGPLIWLHGVSVGEGLALLPLAEAVAARRPDATLLVTSATRASADLLARRLPPGAIHQFAPLDTPGAVGRFLGHWRPDLGVLAESELWPNLILAARARGTRLSLVSGRLSPASAARWRRAPASARAILGAFDIILARDAAAAETLTSLGAHVAGLADLKFAAAPLPVDADELARLKAALKDRSVVLGASTHPGEEEILLDAFRAAADGTNALLIVAPRHPERGAEIEVLARARGFRAARRTAGRSLRDCDVYIADTVGELGLFYRLARLSVIGGSLVAGGPGGHNPLEPARLGRPFVAGPNVGAWPVYGDLGRVDATRLVDPLRLAETLRAAVTEPCAFADMAERARAFVAAGDAAAADALSPILARLPR